MAFRGWNGIFQEKKVRGGDRVVNGSEPCP